MPFTPALTSFPDTLAWSGGELVTIIRRWPTTNLPLSCRLEVADVALPCATGRSDQGAAIVPIGRTVRLASPALPRRLWQRQSGALVFRDQGGAEVFRLPVGVGPPLYDTQTYALRTNLPPRWAAGPRSVLAEPPARDFNLAALTAAMGGALSLFGGQRQTRLTKTAQVGDTVLEVERSEELPDPGRVSVGRVTYRCRNNTPTQLRNLQAEVGGQLVPGVLGEHLGGAPVTDLSGRYSELDSLRRSLFIDTAEGADLAVIGRMLGVPRSPSLTGDQQYRDLIKALGYAARGSQKTLEDVLDILIGPGKYTLEKDPFKNPGQVVVQLPDAEPTSDVPTGRAYLSGETPLVPQADGSFVVPLPLLGSGAVTVAPDVIAEQLLAAPPSAAWSYSSDRAAYLTVAAGRNGTVWSGLRGTLGSAPKGVAAAGRLVVAFIGAFVPPTGAASRDLLQLVADNGSRKAVAILATDGSALTARLVAADGSALSATVPVAGGVAAARHWQLVLTNQTARLWCDGALVLQATTTVASTLAGTRLLSAKAADTTWDLRLQWLMRAFTSTQDHWAGRATATATSADTVQLDRDLLVAQDVGKTVLVGSTWAEVEQVVDARHAKLRRPLGTGGTVRRAGGVSYLDVGTVPMAYPQDLGGRVDVLASSSQSSGSFALQALYEPSTGRDLATYRTPLVTPAGAAKLDGNPQPAANVPYRLAMRLTTGQTAAFELSAAGTLTRGADTATLVPRQALADKAATYVLTLDRVLSAQVFDQSGPDVTKLNDAPPYAFSKYPLFVYDPYDLVDTYLPSVIPVGGSVQVRHGNS